MQQNFTNFVLLYFASSAVTHLRCGGQGGMGFVANFLENTTVKEFWKSANICQCHEQMYNGTVYLHTV